MQYSHDPQKVHPCAETRHFSNEINMIIADRILESQIVCKEEYWPRMRHGWMMSHRSVEPLPWVIITATNEVHLRCFTCEWCLNFVVSLKRTLNGKCCVWCCPACVLYMCSVVDIPILWHSCWNLVRRRHIGGGWRGRISGKQQTCTFAGFLCLSLGKMESIQSVDQQHR